MERFKICPICGKKNSAASLECECGADLSFESVQTEAQYQEVETAEPKQDSEFIRLCDSCGEENPANARVCARCGEDISDVVPSARAGRSLLTEEKGEKKSFCLASIDGSYAFKVSCQETIVGRENAMSEYLKDKTFVGRKHCQFLIEGEQLFVVDLNSTNGTYVNNERVIEKHVLEDGDELALGGINKNGKRSENAAYFIVSVNPCM